MNSTRRTLPERARAGTTAAGAEAAMAPALTRGIAWPLAAIAAAVLACAPARAAELAADHPLIGTWKLPIAQLNCTETYLFLRDGTSRVTSAAEISESRFEISAAPSAGGFYRWTDTIVKNNGKKDCSGAVTQAGKSVTQYVLFHHSHNLFFICQEEKRNTCFGPFYRQRGQDT